MFPFAYGKELFPVNRMPAAPLWEIATPDGAKFGVFGYIDRSGGGYYQVKLEPSPGTTLTRAAVEWLRDHIVPEAKRGLWDKPSSLALVIGHDYYFFYDQEGWSNIDDLLTSLP